MGMIETDRSSRRVFGVSAVLAQIECTELLDDLTRLWVISYGRVPSNLESDLKECRKFFDPVARGQTLRERLAKVAPAPSSVVERMSRLGQPLVVDAGEGALLVGVEARLLIEILLKCKNTDGSVILPERAIADAERTAMQIYREWTVGRLTQVIQLRMGNGKEPMQPVAVGIVVALLVNRSNTPDRAVVQWGHHTPDGMDVDTAIYVGAEAFAAALSSGGRGRSLGEQKLKGGYALTEARRRLAHRLAVVASTQIGEKLIFIPEEHRDDVVEFLGRDMARRSSLAPETLRTAFDKLVASFRASAQALSYRSMTFERTAETNDLKLRLLEAFISARTEAGK